MDSHFAIGIRLQLHVESMRIAFILNIIPDQLFKVEELLISGTHIPFRPMSRRRRLRWKR